MIWLRTAIWNAIAVLRGSLDFIRDDGDDDDDDDGGDDDDDDDDEIVDCREWLGGKLIRKDAGSHTESCMIMIIWGEGRGREWWAVWDCMSCIPCQFQSDRVSFVVARGDVHAFRYCINTTSEQPNLYVCTHTGRT